MRETACLSLLQCDEFWGSQFSPETCLLPFRNHHPVWPGFGRSWRCRNSWALGSLGAGAAPRLWVWGKVGHGQPQNSKVVRGSEQEL